MSSIARIARAYWRLNGLAWVQVRRVAVPLLVAFGVLSVALWGIGVARDNTPLQWAPAVYVWMLLISFQLARLPV